MWFFQCVVTTSFCYRALPQIRVRFHFFFSHFHAIPSKHFKKRRQLLRWRALYYHISGPKRLILPQTKPTSNYKRSKRRDKRCDISAKLMRHFLEQHNAKHFHYLYWTVVHRSSLLVSIRSLSWFVQIKGVRSMGVSMGKAERKVGFFS